MNFSRRRVVFTIVTIFVVLDGARSLSARFAAATPSRVWSPETSYAQPIPWPPGRDLAADAPVGQRVYLQHCAVCHGPTGRGNGPASPSLHPKPRDFTGGVFKFKSTAGAAPPTLADVRATIQRGMPGTSMPAWQDILSDAQIDAVAEFVRRFGPHTQWTTEGVRPPAPESMATASVDEGRELYVNLGCPACHGKYGRGDGSSAKDLQDVWHQPAFPRDLTAPWTFRGGSSPEALYLRIALGIAGTPMPGYGEVAEPQQIAAVVAYVRSIARPPAWEQGGVLGGPGQSTDPVVRGEYLVHAGMCGLCHTPVDVNGIYLADSHYLAGGMKVDAGAHGVFFTRNLTPDAETGLGQWTVEQIATAIRTGHAPTRRLNYWGMPWMVLAVLTHDDALAIASHLKTLPPVRNEIPAPLHYGVIETVARKLTYGWPALMPPRLSYYAGNFGYAQPVPLTRDLPQRVLIWAQVLVLALGVVGFILAPASAAGSRGQTVVTVGVLCAVGALLVIVYRYPAVDFLPTDAVVGAFTSSIPPVQTDGLPPHLAALLQRGRYLYTISSCPYCHNGNGAGGGKVNWSVLGTTWTRNLTAHPSGLAGWSDEAVLRALVSGVSRDGRPLHWQGMIWDHLSNYTVEDQHALLAYVRALPGVDRTIPPPAPPSTNDCPGDTFWIGTTNFDPGCR